METDTKKLKITWETAVKQFENLIKFAAKQQVENHSTDSSISAEDLYQEGMIKLYDCWRKWCVGLNKDMDEFGPIFKKSLFRCLKKRTVNRPQMIDLEDTVESLADTNAEDIVENMYRDYGIKHLTEILNGETARELLGELLNPSNRTLYEVWADIKRKEMIKSQGKKVNIPKDTTVRMKHIIRSMGITTKQYDIAMAEIKEKARIVLKESLAF